jgi:6-phosphogluconolactonase (cycloisomerase 2 family)
MKNLFRVLLGFLATLAMLLLTSCAGSYGCRVTFGSSTCTPSGSGLGSGGGTGGGGGGGGGNGSANAFAYVVDGNGAMDGYALSTTGGTFGPVSTFKAPVIPANSGGVGVVVAQGKFLYAVFEDLQQIYGWSIDSSGNLTALSGFPVSVPLSGITAFTYNQQVVITNPAGTLLFISEFSNEAILVYQISSTGTLTAAAGSPFSTLPASLEPQNMAMDGQGRFLYVAEDSGSHSGSFVVGYSVSSSGVLTEIPGSPFNVPLWEMQGDPSGKYLLGISGKVQFLFGSDDKSLYVYNIDQTTGALSAVGGSPFATVYAPFNIAVQPTSSNGEFVYSFSINDSDTGANPIEAYQLNTTTGVPSAVSGSPFSGLTTTAWGQFDQSGAYLFVYSGVSPDFSMGVLNVSSSGGLTETLATTPLVTGGYWAASDVP